MLSPKSESARSVSVRLPGVSRLTFGAGVKKRLMESAANDSMVFPSSIFGGMSQSAVCRLPSARPKSFDFVFYSIRRSISRFFYAFHLFL